MKPKGQPSFFGVLAFGALLLLPSLDIPLKYLGITGMVSYFALGLVGVTVGYYRIVPWVLEMVGERKAAVLTVLVLVLLGIYAMLLYPIANSGRFGGGTDVDDALIIGVTELTSGRYPYYQQTYLGGFLSPMPGAILLAVPFVLLGILPLQNVFWLGMLALTAKRIEGSYVHAKLIVLTVLLISPTAYQVLATGSDHISNSIYILVSMWLLVRAVSKADSPSWTRILPAFLLGVGLSSRSNFFVLMPILFSTLTQNSDWRTAFKYCALAVAVFLGVTVPFWAYDPPAFAPFLVQAGRLQQVQDILPYAPVIVPATIFLLSGAFSLTRMTDDGFAFFRNCAIVQLAALYISSILHAADVGEFTLFIGNVGYGMFTIFFAAVSATLYMIDPLGNGERHDRLR